VTPSESADQPGQTGSAEPAGPTVRDAVRPVRARVVRQDHALAHVVPLDELVGPATPPVPSQRVPGEVPEAYDARAPGLYVYRLRRGDEEHVAVVGDVGVEAFARDRVRGHEDVQSDRVRALVDHWARGGPRTALVALLHPPLPTVAGATARVQDADPLLRFTGADGWEQTVWPVPEAEVAGLTAALGCVRHYVADGHHRIAASRAWHDDGRPGGDAVMCAMYPFGSLRVSAFHRRLPGPVRADALLDALSQAFEVRPAREAPAGDPADATFALYVGGRWYDAVHTGVRPPGALGLDAALLDREVVEPLLGPEGRCDQVETFADHGDPSSMVEACDRDGGALFLLRPPTLDQLVEVADRGEVMPPKTTYFAPKPHAGIFLR